MQLKMQNEAIHDHQIWGNYGGELLAKLDQIMLKMAKMIGACFA